ncbi:MAG: class I SAM-dependent methyltransferase [Calditrichaeota bacterium]|nr:MAG: class I SAM-dependent methyltransferase [Calditrichota bacterium]
MWDKRYNTEEYVYGKHPNRFLVRHVDRLPKGKVLCLAEGEGRNAVYLAEQGLSVVAVDSSVVGLKKAQKLAASRDVEIKTVVADLADFTIEPESWDAIISIFCHLPAGLRKKLHKKCVAGLRPGGIFLLQAYTPDQLHYGTGGPPVIELLISLAELEQELNGLIFEEARETVCEIKDGKLHDGQSAVVQIVAAKPAAPF